MVCRRVTSFPQLLAIWTLILLTFGMFFSHARRGVLEVSTVVATDKEFAVHGAESSFSSQKENVIVGGDVPSAATEVKTHKMVGRRSMSDSSSADHKVRNTDETSSSAGEEKEEQWKEVSVVDYTPPRAHPPVHN